MFGALPAGGAEIPTFLSYTYEKRRAKNRAEFGKGAIEGVAGPEAANNAAFSGVLVPLLTAHVSEHLGLYVYYGSRSAQPARVRAFIDLVAARLADNPALVLSPQEMAAAVARWRKGAARRR